jgi:peptidoglycan/xylan/chitin deacetylase (PgdA/CDA1 family)
MRRDRQRGAIAAQIFDGRRPAADLPHDLTLMDWNQIAELKAAGHVIGSHGAMHRKLSRLPAEAQTEEIADADRRLTEMLGGKTDWYAYAFGDIASIDRMALQTIARHHRFCRSGVRGINSSTTSPLALRGDELDLSAPLAYQQLIADGGLAPLYAKAAQHLDALAS